jgi:PAS domain S-box-containing protein
LTEQPEKSAQTAPLDMILRLAARSGGAPAQLCLFEGPSRGSRTTDPRAPDVSDIAREAVARGRLTWGLKGFAGQVLDVVARPVFAAGRAVGAVCLVGAPTGDATEDVMADVAVMIGRELDGHAGEAVAQSAGGAEIPPMLVAMIDSVPLAVALYDTDFTLLRVSERWGFDFGLRPERMLGRHMFEIDPTARRWESQYRNCMKGERLVADRVPITRKDGKTVYINATTIPWRRTDGEVGGIMGMYQVLMDDRGEEYELVNAQRRLEAAIKLASIHVWEMDYRTKSVWGAGDEFVEEDDVVGFLEMSKDMSAGIHPDDREAAAAELAAARRERRPYRGEYRMDRKDRREVWVSAASADFYGETGEIETRLGVLVDITKRKRAEQALIHAKADAEAANRAKSDFLATMSHEIRTPLNGVLGMARAMEGDELTPAQRARLEVVRQSGESLLSLLNDVLDLSKVEAGKLELDIEPFDLCEVVSSAHAMFAGVAQGKGVALEMVVDDAARGAYRGDAARVRQIIANLISNALKFTDKGRAEVAVARTVSGIEIRVSDTGIGIPADRVDKLFQKFEQADASTTRRFGGTGLGLAICREFSELMGGSVRVTSTQGEGSTFIVELPLPRLEDVDVAPRAALPQQSAPPPEAEDTPPLRVLAAEDNKVNQLVLRTLLNQAGIDPVIVDDGRAAVEAWEQSAWDVILMDVQMPVMDGPAATRIIRQREAASGRAMTPIIALTANVMSHQVRDYELAGMNGWVAKPIEVAALFAGLEAALALGAEAAGVQAA